MATMLTVTALQCQPFDLPRIVEVPVVGLEPTLSCE